MECSLDDLAFLRLHVEAGWGIELPALHPGDVVLADSPRLAGPSPSWDLYAARLDGADVRIWRIPVTSGQREQMAAAASDAGSRALALPLPSGIRGDVAFRHQGGSTGDLTEARRLDASDRAVIDAFEPGEVEYYLAPHRAPLVGCFVGGRLASVAHSSRRTPNACELGVHTLAAYRRQGLARAATVLWAREVGALGLAPIYSADWGNRASHALAGAAGFRRCATAVLVQAPAAR